MTTELGLTFSFRGDPDWLRNAASVRMKIESGVVFLKPMTADVVRRNRRTDAFPLTRGKFVLPDYHELTGRVQACLERLGLTRTRCFFALHQASRGWYAISLQAEAVVPDGLAVSVTQPVATSVVTAEDVAALVNAA